MTPTYDGNRKTLLITPAKAVKFSDIENIYYGSKAKGDLNLCSEQGIFDYRIVSSSNPNLGPTTNLTGLQVVTYELAYMGAAKLSNIVMSVGFFDSGIINVKWRWANSTGKREIFKVPDDLVNTTARDLSHLVDTLDKQIVITDAPFQIQFKTRISPKVSETVLTIKGLIFDEFLNWVNIEAMVQPSESEEQFRGIFGLGERSQKEFYMKTGVYSMWATDIPDPLEDGKLPGKQVYGTHPFYMFRHGPNNWLGVYHNLAQAQDWWIDNDWTSGTVKISQIATGGLGDIYVFLASKQPETIVAKYHSMIGTPVLVP